MRLIDVCFAVCAPRCAMGLTLLLLTAQAPAAQVTLTWDASPSAAVGGYRLYYGTQSRVYAASIDLGMSTTYTISGLARGQQYYFAVTAYDRTGEAESDFSAEITTALSLPDEPAPVPEEPASAEVITIEAEAMALRGFHVESNADASGGVVISRRDALRLFPGAARAPFTGPAGAYDIIVSYFDENDGQSTLALTVNGKVIDSWLADADLPSGGPSAVTLTSRVVATGLLLAPGDIIALEGRDQGGEYARLDKVEFVPLP